MDATNITTNVQAKPAKPPVTRVDYHGKGGQVFRLHLANLFLTVITLGIYSFWGKTRIRKYMTSHIAIQNDRFEYTGTGKELFYGALKAMLIFILLYATLIIPVVNIVSIFVFLGLSSLVVYMALRYRLSRTRWRGIRFNLGGSLKEYFKLSLKRTFVNIFTLGWKIPKSDIIRWSYIANNMSYGDLKFGYQIDNERMKKVTKLHLMTVPLFFLLVLGPLVMGGVMKGSEILKVAKEKAEHKQIQSPQYPMPTSSTPEPIESEPNSKEDFSLFILPMYVGLGIFFFARLWYYAALWQEKFRGLKLAGLRFKTDMTGGGLAKLYFTNILIIIFTLGLGKPIALNRTLRYYATNMRIAGDLNALIAQQDQSKKISGLGDALAADVGLDLGL
jgi:uncharacterized membrane protein YjgN (DUF898 family)